MMPEAQVDIAPPREGIVAPLSDWSWRLWAFTAGLTAVWYARLPGWFPLVYGSDGQVLLYAHKPWAPWVWPLLSGLLLGVTRRRWRAAATPLLRLQRRRWHVLALLTSAPMLLGQLYLLLLFNGLPRW